MATNERACLFEWFQNSIGSHREILVGSAPALLVQLKPLTLHYLDLILQEHGEVIQNQGLEELFAEKEADARPESEWSIADVREKIRRELDEKAISLDADNTNETVLGNWSEDLQWLCDALPFSDGVFVLIEDSLPNFLKRLLECETTSWESMEQSSVAHPVQEWLGRLALLTQHDSRDWEDERILKEAHLLIKEFNDLNSLV